ncbi:LysR family transcriptional regulator [Vibrio viridaestus]|uniref:LysR family transcriptional regulator n=1 Tax=Vibrio viridaestus TaxID=2487322 RepID=A0A3N9U0X6_9VIBR|nr:LysR family transcriptional regulator [Vibrio viridaestus]RQW61346.1 LysR family transcriptional regulator [Vibrio viridaestus]
MSYLQENRIKFFYEAVQHGSVRAAADFLNIAPSAVSRQISHLEQELDTVLIERHRRGIKPTDAGEELLRYYKRYQMQQEILLDNLKSLRGLQSGTIELAVGEGYINITTKVMYEFSKLYPGVQIHLSVHSGNDILRKVIDDDVHIGIVFNPPPHPKIRSHYSSFHPMVVAVGKEHPLNAEEQPLRMSVLKKYPIALPDMAHGVRHLIAEVENETCITLTPNIISNNLTALHCYAASGGVTIIPDFMIRGMPDWYHSLNCLLLKNERLNKTDTHVISRLGRQMGKAPSTFLKMLISRIEKELVA